MGEIEEHKQGLQEHVEGANDKLADSLTQKLNALPIEYYGDNCTIFRVPDAIRKSKPDLFMPAVVSIGPYHRGYPHLTAMEERKLPLLRDFLHHSNNISLKVCIAELRALETQARRCYSETINMDSDSFVEMMLLDSSFILLRLFKTQPETLARYEDAGWSANMILSDLILMENQIPFFILQKMHNFLDGDNIIAQDIKWIAKFLTDHRFLSTKTLPPPDKIHHLLHLCYYYIVPPIEEHHKTKSHSHIWPRLRSQTSQWFPNRPIAPAVETKWSTTWSVPCATDLKEAGVMIRRKDSPCDITNVTFQPESGVLEIPFIRILDRTPIILMNLVALEQCTSLRLPKIISTYLFFMDAIVNTTNDVIILQRKGIIDNLLSTEEEVALLFNQSCRGVLIDENHSLASMFKEINEYLGQKKHRYRAKMMRDYFSSPWSMLSLVAAMILLLLTLTQTFYSVFSYHHPP